MMKKIRKKYFLDPKPNFPTRRVLSYCERSVSL